MKRQKRDPLVRAVRLAFTFCVFLILAITLTLFSTFEIVLARTDILGGLNTSKQVLRVLTDNAVKYTPKGGTITIGVQKSETGVTLSISDNGPGIPAEELPKIFERFYRSDSARKAEGGGHGLGLSIARIIVKAHSGKLRVRSKVDSGSTFFVDLPEKQPITTPESAVSADVE